MDQVAGAVVLVADDFARLLSGGAILAVALSLACCAPLGASDGSGSDTTEHQAAHYVVSERCGVFVPDDGPVVAVRVLSGVVGFRSGDHSPFAGQQANGLYW
jgi:hypothetical protein